MPRSGTGAVCVGSRFAQMANHSVNTDAGVHGCSYAAQTM